MGQDSATERTGNSPASVVVTDIPARLDRLPWGRFHTLVVIALGITWILDGLEVTLAGALSGALKESRTLHFTNTEIGLASSAYLLGAVLGAVFFGWLTDRLGRKKLFFVTLSVPFPGISAALRCSASSRVRASVANTRRSILPSRSWSRRACADGPTS
jgi:MFS family permease